MQKGWARDTGKTQVIRAGTRHRERLVVQNDIVICRCEEITLGEIVAAIEAGAATLREIRIRTRAGMGLCQGRSCGRLVAGLLARHTGRPLGAMRPRRGRAPVRPLPTELLAEPLHEEEDR